MNNKKAHPPVIIIGMHRSGTTMTAKMLEQMGVFMGKNLDRNHEPLFFIKKNDWLLRQVGGAWDNPEPIDSLLTQQDLMALAVDYLRHIIFSFPAVNFFGIRHYASRSMGRNEDPWGWKDPRNTFTLPIWLKIFPDARIIHVFRNGVDVASSLRERAKKILKNSKHKHEMRKSRGIYVLRLKNKGFVEGVRCLNLSGGFALWETYLKRAMHYKSQLNNQILAIKYEDFIKDPLEHLEKIAAHIGIDANKTRLQKITNGINRDRCLAYQNDHELSLFYEKVKDSNIMRALGY